MRVEWMPSHYMTCCKCKQKFELCFGSNHIIEGGRKSIGVGVSVGGPAVLQQIISADFRKNHHAT